jgi:two-component system, chemotaxis family, chemotaxis protein CheY
MDERADFKTGTTGAHVSLPIRILVVDDAAFMRKMIRDIFTGEEFEVVGEAQNGREAIAAFRELQPDLVTMDVVMPEMGGIEATRELLALRSDVVVLICSALGQEALVMEAIEAGASDFIVKPFNPADVLSVVRKVMGR